MMKEALSTTLAGMATLLAAAALSAGMMGHFSLSLPDPAPQTPAGLSLRAEDEGIPVVEKAEMRLIVETSSHVILDARPLSHYDEEHIPTSFSLPVTDFADTFPRLLPMLQSNPPVVVYCTGPLCDEALQLILLLREAGITNTSLYLEGMEGWRED